MQGLFISKSTIVTDKIEVLLRKGIKKNKPKASVIKFIVSQASHLKYWLHIHFFYCHHVIVFGITCVSRMSLMYNRIIVLSSSLKLKQK